MYGAPLQAIALTRAYFPFFEKCRIDKAFSVWYDIFSVCHTGFDTHRDPTKRGFFHASFFPLRQFCSDGAFEHLAEHVRFSHCRHPCRAPFLARLVALVGCAGCRTVASLDHPANAVFHLDQPMRQHAKQTAEKQKPLLSRLSAGSSGGAARVFCLRLEARARSKALPLLSGMWAEAPGRLLNAPQIREFRGDLI